MGIVVFKLQGNLIYHEHFEALRHLFCHICDILTLYYYGLIIEIPLLCGGIVSPKITCDAIGAIDYSYGDEVYFCKSCLFVLTKIKGITCMQPNLKYIFFNRHLFTFPYYFSCLVLVFVGSDGLGCTLHQKPQSIYVGNRSDLSVVLCVCKWKEPWSNSGHCVFEGL